MEDDDEAVVKASDVKEVRVYAKDQIEIVWSFSKPEVNEMAMPE